MDYYDNLRYYYQYQNAPSYNQYVPIQQMNPYPPGGAPRPPPSPIPAHAGGSYRGRGGGPWRPPQEDTFPQRRHERRRRSHLDDIYFPNYDDEDELDAVDNRYRGSFHHKRKYAWRPAEPPPSKNRNIREIEITKGPAPNDKTHASKLDKDISSDKNRVELPKDGAVEQSKVVTSTVKDDDRSQTTEKNKDTNDKLILDVDDKINTRNSETETNQSNINSSDTKRNNVDVKDAKISKTEDESAINSNCATAKPETDQKETQSEQKEVDVVEEKVDSTIPADVPKCTLEPEVTEGDISSSHPLPKTFPIWEPFDTPRGRIASVREVESDEETICFDDFITIDRIDTTRSYLSSTTPDFDDCRVIEMDVDSSTPSPDDFRIIDMDTGTPSPCKRKTDGDESTAAKKAKYDRLYHDINSDKLLKEIDEVLMEDKGVAKPAKGVVRYRSKSLTDERNIEPTVAHSTKSKSLDCINKNQSQDSCDLDVSTNLLLLLDPNYLPVKAQQESDVKAPHVPRTDPRISNKSKSGKSESHLEKDHSEKRASEGSDTTKPSLVILREYKKSMDFSKKILPPEMALQKIMASPAKLITRRTTFSNENDLHIEKMHRLFGSDSDPEDNEVADINSIKSDREKVNNKRRKSCKADQKDPQPKKLFSGTNRDGKTENRRHSVAVVSETKGKSKDKKDSGVIAPLSKESKCPSASVVAPSSKHVEDCTKMSKNDVLHTAKQAERRGSSPVCTNGTKTALKSSSNSASSRNNDKDKPKTLSNHKRTSTDGKNIKSLKESSDKDNVKDDKLKMKSRWDVKNFIKSCRGKPSQKSSDCATQKQMSIKDKKSITAVNKTAEDSMQNKTRRTGVVIDSKKAKTVTIKENVKTVTSENNEKGDHKPIKAKVEGEIKPIKEKSDKAVKTTFENKYEKAVAKPNKDGLQNFVKTECLTKMIKDNFEKNIKITTVENKNENSVKAECEIKSIKENSENTAKTAKIEKENEIVVAKTECQTNIIKENSEKIETVQNENGKGSDISPRHFALQPKLVLDKIDPQIVPQTVDNKEEPVVNRAATDFAAEPTFVKCSSLPKDQFPLSQRARCIAAQDECCDTAVVLERSDVRDTVETVKIRKKSLNVVISIQPTENFYEVIDLTGDQPENEALNTGEEQEIDLGLNDNDTSEEERITLYRSDETLNSSLEVQAMVASMSPSTLNKTKPEGDKKPAVSEKTPSNDEEAAFDTKMQYLTKLLVEKAVEAAKDHREQQARETQTTNPSHNTIKFKYTPGTFISHGTVQDLGDIPAKQTPAGHLNAAMHNIETLKKQKLKDVRRPTKVQDQGSGLIQQNSIPPTTFLVPQVPRRAEEDAAQKPSSVVVQCPGGIQENIPLGFIAQIPRNEGAQAVGNAAQRMGDNISQVPPGFVAQIPRRTDDIPQMASNPCGQITRSEASLYQQIPRTEVASVQNKPQMPYMPSFSSVPQPQRSMVGNSLPPVGQRPNGNSPKMTFMSMTPVPGAIEDVSKQMHPLRREDPQLLGRDSRGVNVRQSEPPPLVDVQVHMQRNVICTLTKYISFYHNLRIAQAAYSTCVGKQANVFPDLVNAEIQKFNADATEKYHALSKSLVRELLKVNTGLMFTTQNCSVLVSNVHKLVLYVLPQCTLSWVYFLLETIIGLEAAEYIKVPFLRELYGHVRYITGCLRDASTRKRASQNGPVPSNNPAQETLTAQQRQLLEWQIQEYTKICQYVQSCKQPKIPVDASKSSPSPSYGCVTVQTSYPQAANAAINTGSILGNPDSSRNPLEVLKELVSASCSKPSANDNFRIRLPYTRPYDMPATPAPSSATESQRYSLATNTSTTLTSTSNKDTCDIISNADQSRSIVSSVQPMNIPPIGTHLNGQSIFSVASSSQMDNQPITSPINTQVTDPGVVTQQPINNIPEVSIQAISTPVTTSQVASQPITKPINTPVINPQVAESASSQPADEPQVKLEIRAERVFEDGEVIDLTWMNDIDPEQLQNEIQCFEVKKEEAEEVVEETVQEVGPLREEYAANSPADSGISSPPIQIEYNEQVFLDRTCICGQSAEYVCGCMSAMYCSVPCQLKHWASHKELCLKRKCKYKEDSEPQQENGPSDKN